MTVLGRVTQRNLQDTTLANLQQSMGRLARLQGQLSSGRQLQRPSDDPAGVVSALQYRAELRRADQYQRNAQNGLDWLGTADNALTDLGAVLIRVRELTLSGMNGSMGATERNAIAAEIEQLRASALALANTEYLGQPVFGGTAGAAYSLDAGGNVVFNGNDDDVVRTVGPNATVPVNVRATAAFGGPGADVFTVLGNIATHLRTDPASLGSDLQALDVRRGALTDAQSTAGARYKQVESVRDRTDGDKITKQNSLAEIEGVDIAATITELKLQEMAHEAALAASARVLQPSLLDFLR